MPNPTSTTIARLEGNAKPTFTPTDHPTTTRGQGLKITPGPNFDQAMMRSMQSREELRTISIGQMSFITTAYRRDGEQYLIAQQNEQNSKESSFKGMRLVSQAELDRLASWLTPKAKAHGPLHGTGLRLTDLKPTLSRAAVSELFGILGVMMANKQTARRGKLLIISVEDGETLWGKPGKAMEIGQKHGVTFVTIDTVDKIIVPFCSNGHWSLVVANVRAKQLRL